MSWRPNEENNSDSEDETEYGDFGGREAIIFLVDAFLSEDSIQFQECLNIIRKALLGGLMIKEKDLIGVVFCNTQHKPDPKDVDGIKNIVVKENTAILLPLKPLTKDIVSYFLDFSNAESDHFDFNRSYGCSVGSFANSIWLCANMFKHCGTKLSAKSIVMLTNRDIPPDIGPMDFQKAIKKASDLNEIDIEFTVVPMKNDFNYDAFYKEFMCTTQDIELDEFVPPDPEEERELICKRQLRQNFRKQCRYRLRWALNGGLEISTAIYNYYRQNVYPKSVKLLREDNSIVDVKHVFKITSIHDEDRTDERNCRPGDERKVITVGGQKITFTSDELAKMKSPLTPRLTLLGFKPRSSISIHNFIKSTSFLYPDEKVIEGSTKLFRALWEKCIELDRIAICVLVSRRKSSPRYVALVPSMISMDGINHMEKDGFKIFYLPFEIDYRDIDLSEWNLPDIPESGIELFQKIVKKLKYIFAPTKIHDPSLEKLRTGIISLALDVEPDDEAMDDTIDIEQQDSRIHSYIQDLKSLFGEDLEDVRKRRGEDGSGNEKQSKMVKVSDENVTEEDILRLLANKNLNKLTAKQLKSYLMSKDVKGISSATKSILIEKVLELHS